LEGDDDPNGDDGPLYSINLTALLVCEEKWSMVNASEEAAPFCRTKYQQGRQKTDEVEEEKHWLKSLNHVKHCTLCKICP
jgi:hypothetical protein